MCLPSVVVLDPCFGSILSWDLQYNLKEFGLSPMISHRIPHQAGLSLLISPTRCRKALQEAKAISKDGLGAFASSQGMAFDEYSVVTSDRWKLKIHRVRSPDVYNSTLSTPVLISHGLTCSSADFMMNPRSESLAFILADNGFDVFLVNHRGNQFSYEKVSKSGLAYPAKGEDIYESAWQFMSQYDIPAALDFILKETGHDKIHLVAHSQGNPVILGFLGSDHSYDDKVGHFAALSPVVILGDDLGPTVKLFLRAFAPIVEKLPTFLFKIVTQARILTSAQTFGNRFIYPFCDFLPGVCQLTVNWILQRDLIDFFTLSPEFDKGRTTVLKAVWPGGVTGMNTYELSSQIYMKQEAWTRIDYRKIPQSGITNQEMYNREDPPEFKFDEARVNSSYIFAKNDVFLGLKSAQRIVDWLKPMNQLIVDEERFSHVDFLWSWRAACLVYNFVVEQFVESDVARSAPHAQYRRVVAEHLKSLESPRCSYMDSL
ncbi:lipase 3 [Galendromus occidentalis]|uniref:Lipase 3 n=1 Tax=Galendromus occidentalis TaxID=34638 RepID=A0AAJ7PAD4_9ACAR|nr:lipase 3 [Galendromus occidentalis]